MPPKGSSGVKAAINKKPAGISKKPAAAIYKKPAGAIHKKPAGKRQAVGKQEDKAMGKGKGRIIKDDTWSLLGFTAAGWPIGMWKVNESADTEVWQRIS